MKFDPFLVPKKSNCECMKNQLLVVGGIEGGWDYSTWTCITIGICLIIHLESAPYIYIYIYIHIYIYTYNVLYLCTAYTSSMCIYIYMYNYMAIHRWLLCKPRSHGYDRTTAPSDPSVFGPRAKLRVGWVPAQHWETTGSFRQSQKEHRKNGYTVVYIYIYTYVYIYTYID